MESEGVSLPMFHEHDMMPWNDLRRGDCCRCYEAISDGYYCKTCDFFFHKKCVEESPHSIEHPSHSHHTLQLQNKPGNRCDLSGSRIKSLCYRCDLCDFDMDLCCAKYPPPEVIDISETHHHKLTLFKEREWIKCGAKCGNDSYGLPYKCHECDLAFHGDCVWHHPSEIKNPLELNHSYHSLHPFKLLIGQTPEYSDGKCLLCGRKVDEIFYHCSSCNFTVDMRCVLNPPPRSLLDLKAHDHQLTLLLRLDSFTCNACGLKGDHSPYICVQCGFMIHQECLDLPRLIHINRHDHRVSRTSKLGVVNSVCGVCHKKVDWIWGGYSCEKCPGYVVHSKCATRKDVWNGKELEGVPEETEDINPYVVVDDNTIQHFSHREHYLRLQVNGGEYEENKRCNACSHPISFQSFYSCMENNCDFILHKKCAECPKKKRHVLHNDRLTLITSDTDDFQRGCYRHSNGFRYKHGNKKFDVLCSSISEPFVHPSHPEHPLYHIPSDINQGCNNCNWETSNMLSCIEDDCIFNICFKCVTLPQMVKHRVDDHPLSLCYREKASGILWCDICETKTNSEKWFYTCKDHLLCLHTRCVIGNFSGFMPRSTIDIYGKDNEVVLNNSMSRPLCRYCKLRCIFPIILKLCGASNVYFCSLQCI